jgi:hypothetical protein
MECPECGTELEWEDYFGKLGKHLQIRHDGDIYICTNEDCNFHYWHTYTSAPDNLIAGYPC